MSLTDRFIFVLHSHIPYVMHHGQWPHGEHWLYEAAVETYLPLIQQLERCVADGIRPAITIGLTPVLVEQLESDRFKAGFVDYLETKVTAAEKDISLCEASGETDMAALGRMWMMFYQDALDRFTGSLDGSIVGRFRKLQDTGAIEILTSNATHGYMPLLSRDDCVSAQVKAGVATYQKYFGRDPQGIWMPECAYRPAGHWQNPVFPEQSGWRKGVDDILVENGFQYTMIDSPLLGNASLMGVYEDKPVEMGELRYERTPYVPYRLASGLQLFVRDHITGYQVWSRHQGYPGDGSYLEFHKMKDTSGIKYWRITGPDAELGDKVVYDPAKAAEMVRKHAAHFAGLVAQLGLNFRNSHGLSSMLVSPFDAELFGHWWFEGPEWMRRMLTEMVTRTDVRPACCHEMAERGEYADVIRLPEGSWGENADHSVWFNDKTRFIWEALYLLEERFTTVLGQGRHLLQPDSVFHEVMKEAGIALFLAQASDWPFLIHTGGAVDYAEERFTGHVKQVKDLLDKGETLVGGGTLSDVDRDAIAEMARKNNVFRDLDLNWWLDA